MENRQRRYQKKMQADGKCQVCGRECVHYKGRCDGHALQHREAQRRLKGSKKRYKTRVD